MFQFKVARRIRRCVAGDIEPRFNLVGDPRGDRVDGDDKNAVGVCDIGRAVATMSSIRLRAPALELTPFCDRSSPYCRGTKIDAASAFAFDAFTFAAAASAASARRDVSNADTDASRRAVAPAFSRAADTAARVATADSGRPPPRRPL
jgi:hypothetical protein